MGGSVRLLRQLSGFESRHLSKIQNRRHKQRSCQHTLAGQKNNIKDCLKYLPIGLRNKASSCLGKFSDKPYVSFSSIKTWGKNCDHDFSNKLLLMKNLRCCQGESGGGCCCGPGVRGGSLLALPYPGPNRWTETTAYHVHISLLWNSLHPADSLLFINIFISEFQISQHFWSVRIRFRIQGFDDQNLKKFKAESQKEVAEQRISRFFLLVLLNNRKIWIRIHTSD